MEKDTLRLRAAESSDAATMMALHASAFARPWDEEAMRDFASDPSCLCLLAEEGGAASGLLIARIAADEAELLTLAVHPSVRRKGLANALLERACRELCARGAATLFLEVAETNRAARELYRKLGFAVLGRRANYYGAKADALILKMRTRPAGAETRPGAAVD